MYFIKIYLFTYYEPSSYLNFYSFKIISNSRYTNQIFYLFTRINSNFIYSFLILILQILLLFILSIINTNQFIGNILLFLAKLTSIIIELLSLGFPFSSKYLLSATPDTSLPSASYNFLAVSANLNSLAV